MVLAGLFVLAAWSVRRSARLRATTPPTADAPPPAPDRRPLALLLLGAGSAALAVLWLPVGLRSLGLWPLGAAALVASWWYLVPLVPPAPPAPSSKREAPSTAQSPGAVTAGILVLFGLSWSSGPAAPPAPPPNELTAADRTVYLLAGPKQEIEVLASPVLLDRLRAPAPAALSGAVLVGADYQAAIAAGAKSARVEAVFQVYCPGPGPAQLTLPLDGILLRPAALLDGALADVTALPPPRAGYAVAVKGPGLHKLQLQFDVRLSADADRVDLLFQGPRVPSCRAASDLPRGVAFPQVVVKRGGQRVREDDKGLHLEADLGTVSLEGVAEVVGPPLRAAAEPLADDAGPLSLAAGGSRRQGQGGASRRRGCGTWASAASR